MTTNPNPLAGIDPDVMKHVGNFLCDLQAQAHRNLTDTERAEMHRIGVVLLAQALDAKRQVLELYQDIDDLGGDL